MDKIKRYLFMLLGCTLLAITLNIFIVPFELVTGGFAGLASLIHYLGGPSIGLVSILLNVPVILLSLRMQGKTFVVNCLITCTCYSILVDVFSFLPPMTENMMIASIYGGVLQGIALGILYRYQVSSGGTELLARMILRVFHMVTPGVMMMLIDGLIVIAGSVLLNDPEMVFYALIFIFISGKVSDMIIMGIDYAKLVFIITESPEEVSKALYDSHTVGITSIEAKGMYTGSKRSILMMVMKKQQFVKVRNIVSVVDPKAFVVVGETTEVLGHGWQEINGN